MTRYKHFRYAAGGRYPKWVSKVNGGEYFGIEWISSLFGYLVVHFIPGKGKGVLSRGLGYNGAIQALHIFVAEADKKGGLNAMPTG